MEREREREREKKQNNALTSDDLLTRSFQKDIRLKIEVKRKIFCITALIDDVI